MKIEAFNRLTARLRGELSLIKIKEDRYTTLPFDIIEDLSILSAKQTHVLYGLLESYPVKIISLNGNYSSFTGKPYVDTFSKESWKSLFAFIKTSKAKTLMLNKIFLDKWKEDMWADFLLELKNSELIQLSFSFSHLGNVKPDFIKALFKAFPLSLKNLKIEAEKFNSNSKTEESWKESFWDLFFSELTATAHIQSLTFGNDSTLGGTINKFWSYGPLLAKTSLRHLGLESIGLESLGKGKQTLEEMGCGSRSKEVWADYLEGSVHSSVEEWLQAQHKSMNPIEAWSTFCSQLGHSIVSLSVCHNKFNQFTAKQWEWFFHGLAASNISMLEMNDGLCLKLKDKEWEAFCSGLSKTNIIKLSYTLSGFKEEQCTEINKILEQNAKKEQKTIILKYNTRSSTRALADQIPDLNISTKKSKKILFKK